MAKQGAEVPVPVVAGDCVRCAHYLGAVVPSIRWDDGQRGGWRNREQWFPVLLPPGKIQCWDDAQWGGDGETGGLITAMQSIARK